MFLFCWKILQAHRQTLFRFFNKETSDIRASWYYVIKHHDESFSTTRTLICDLVLSLEQVIFPTVGEGESVDTASFYSFFQWVGRGFGLSIIVKPNPLVNWFPMKLK